MDRLPSDEKDLLQTLAVIGREFSFGLVRNVVAKSDDKLNRMLTDLNSVSSSMSSRTDDMNSFSSTLLPGRRKPTRCS